MKKRIICMALAAMLLTACTPAAPARPADDDVVTIVCTTYPIYLLAKTVTEGAGGVEIALLDTACSVNHIITFYRINLNFPIS